MVDSFPDALDELIRFRSLRVLVERRFIDPARMEEKQLRIGHRAVGFDAKAPRLLANTGEGITQICCRPIQDSDSAPTYI
jgi:hypothetical protein